MVCGCKCCRCSKCCRDQGEEEEEKEQDIPVKASGAFDNAAMSKECQDEGKGQVEVLSMKALSNTTVF